MASTDGEPNPSRPGVAEGGAKAPRMRAPTWDEVMRTQTPANTRQTDNDQTNSTLCIIFGDSIATKDFVSELKKPIVGRTVCFEHMSQALAKAVHEHRREVHKGDVGWSEKWYGQWTQRWQVMTILGTENHRRYRDLHIISQAARPKMFSDNDQQRLMKIVPMDQAILGWRDDFGEYLKVITKPGWNMTRKYAESWQNGVQMNYLQKIWTNMTDLGAMRLVERMAKLFVRVKDGLSKDDHE